MSRFGGFGALGQNLYEGKVSYDFVGRRNRWYVISAFIVLVAVAGLVVRPLNFGIEFKGGVEFTIVTAGTQEQVDTMLAAVDDSGVEVGTPIGNTAGADSVVVQTEPLEQDQADEVEQAMIDAGAEEVSQERIGATWGEQIRDRALIGLTVFLVLVVLFIWGYFREWRMSVAALLALAHDVVITIGVYAWAGFEVSPATVTGLLTILGYSLYDTVVVYDKVRENTKSFATQTTRTYAEWSNLAINQTLVRSINTSITALLPVVALLIVGLAVVGTGPLKDLALALFVGMAAGTYSSIFIATPFASQLKEREPAVREHAKRVLARRARDRHDRDEADRGPVDETDPAHAGGPEAVGSRASRGSAGSTARPTPRPGARPGGPSGRAQPQRRPRSQRGKGSR
ncbi:MAG: protein translocase subunit SecF [Nocardioidaceae bacterium]|nr:protein translocase subunit SecF [Nocardioidaceae bacterium]